MTLKTFRVCLSSELPVISERDPNYVYFLYDKLVLFNGQNMFYDDFVIIENVPDEPVDGLWYICFDGTIRTRIDYSMVEVAHIENDEQLELLNRAGTMFFYKANRRYLDKRRQLLELPYLNGTYQMSVHLANNIILDENTVIAFNPDTSEFEISGKPQDYDLIFTHDYKAEPSDTVDLKVEDHAIKSEVKISKAANNIIRIAKDGLYASVEDRVTHDAFRQYINSYNQYKEDLGALINRLDQSIEGAQNVVSVNAITNRIRTTLSQEFENVEYALSKFDEWATKFEGIEARCKNQIDTDYISLREELIQEMEDYLNNPWQDIGYASDAEFEKLRTDIITLNGEVRQAMIDIDDFRDEITQFEYDRSPQAKELSILKSDAKTVYDQLQLADIALYSFDLAVQVYEQEQTLGN